MLDALEALLSIFLEDVLTLLLLLVEGRFVMPPIPTTLPTTLDDNANAAAFSARAATVRPSTPSDFDRCFLAGFGKLWNEVGDDWRMRLEGIIARPDVVLFEIIPEAASIGL
jgi:hypothetical protein